MHVKQLLRSLARMPLFTAITVLTLALGIGANTAIFSVIEGVLLKPLPYPRSGELMTLDHAAPGVNIPKAGAAPFLYFTYREEGRVFQDVGLWQTGTLTVTGRAEPEEVPALFVTDGVLPILGVQPMLGRVFSKADDSPGTPETVVLTTAYWRSKFGSDTGVVGKSLMIDSKPREIIGVLPDTFHFLDRQVSLVVPYRLDRSKVFLGQFSFNGIARLKPGTTIAQANADLARLIPLSLTKFPPFPGGNVKMFEEARITPHVLTLKDDLVGEVHTVLWVLMGTIALVLLIACANVANLLLVRAESRQQELAIRAALGAGAARIAREMLFESVSLALLGGAVGLALAFAGLRLLVTLAPGNLPRIAEIGLDVPVLLFAIAVSIAAGLLFGAIPVLKYSGDGIGLALRGGGRTATSSRERHRVRNFLVVAQIALALVLLVSSGLMIRTFSGLRGVNPGFTRPGELQTFRLSIPDSQIKDPEAVARMHQAIADKLATVSGVRSVAVASTVNMSGDGWRDPIYARDRTYSESQIPPIRLFKFVSPGYMNTMGTPLVAGRDFTWTDIFEGRPVAMVSENLARELWERPDAALGKWIRPYSKGAWREVVGVVGDMRDNGLTEKAAAVAYWPLMLQGFDPGDPVNKRFTVRGAAFVVRSGRTGSAGFVDELGRAVWSINANLPLAAVRTVQEIYDRSLARTSFTLVMLGIAGGMALILGVAGIYGVISYSVSQRQREIGIRIALGARPQAVTGMFVRHGLTLAAVGVTLGLAGAAGVMRVITSLLFHVNPIDPLTYAVVALTLIGATVLASYIPALRATTVDPISALRSE
jgi:predicted permease